MHQSTTPARDPAELARAIESQDQFMSFLSHEIRGGLNGATLLLEVIRRELSRRGEPMKEVVTDVESVRDSILHTASMMERALFADRIRRGRIEADVQSTPLVPLIQEAIAKAKKAAKEKAAEVTVHTEVETVETDPPMLSRALLELLHNAMKHGARPITLSASREQDEVVIRIAHPGAALEAERIAHLLDPLRRPTSNEKGVGLVTVVQIARALRGRVEASSDSSRTEFGLILPAENAKDRSVM